MKILAIESSAGPASCAVVEDGRVLASAATNTGLTHSQTLIPMVDALLKNAGIAFDAIDCLAVAVGPGSFTGVRIGVAAVKGLAFAQEKPCMGVSTLAAMVHAIEGMPFTGIVCAAMDARCGQVYTALFACEEGRLSRLTEDEALPLVELKNLALSYKKSILLVGDGAELCYNTFGIDDPNMILSPPHLRYQNAVGVAYEAMSMTGQWVSPADLQPVYLRLPQAERELRQRQGL